MLNFSTFFDLDETKKILVIGDFMLDSYTLGEVSRISPEAPVPVLRVKKEDQKPGGAGNVLLNLKALGCAVAALGRVGQDSTGTYLKKMMKEADIDTQAVIVDAKMKTPVKQRIIASNQQMIRIDREDIVPLGLHCEQILLDHLRMHLESCDAVAISDYAKGLCTHRFMQKVIALCRKHLVPVIVDPKAKSFKKYKGANLIKPNLSEARAATSLEKDASLDQVAQTLLGESGSEALIITRSHQGVSLFDSQGKRQDFPAKVKEVTDVTGAGDTVLSIITYAMSHKLPLDQAIPIANLAASCVIEHVGCNAVTLIDLAKRVLDFNSSNKIFDHDHLFLLEQALQDQDFSLLFLDSPQDLTFRFFEKIRACKKTLSNKGLLLVFAQESHFKKGSLDCLASMQEVDFLIYSNCSLSQCVEGLGAKDILSFRQGEIRPFKQNSSIV